jgi:hypothetical protein
MRVELPEAGALSLATQQEVYDGNGTLREVHHKYPVDPGHQQMTGDEP